MFIRVESIEGINPLGSKTVSLDFVTSLYVDNDSGWKVGAVLGGTGYSDTGTSIQTAVVESGFSTQADAEAALEFLLLRLGVLN